MSGCRLSLLSLLAHTVFCVIDLNMHSLSSESLLPPLVMPTSRLLLRRKPLIRLSSSMELRIIHRVSTRLEGADFKSEPNLQPLAILHEVDLVCHLWQQYVNMALLPLASSSVTTRREMVVFNNQTVSRIEGAANQIMQRLTDCKPHFYTICGIYFRGTKSWVTSSNHCLVVVAAYQAEEDRLQA